MYPNRAVVRSKLGDLAFEQVNDLFTSRTEAQSMAQGVEGMLQTDSFLFHDDSSFSRSGVNEQGAISQFRNGAQTIATKDDTTCLK
jgi:hypothetical protein